MKNQADPIASSEITSESQVSPVAAPSAQPCPRVLIVEDDADQRALLVDALRMYYQDAAGDRIVAVGRGSEALGQDLGRFDVVLQDLNLPDMDGLKLLTAMLDRADVPVIVVTGQNDSNTAAQAIRCGAQDYIVKLGDYLFALPVILDKNIQEHMVRVENGRLQHQLKQMLEQLQEKNQQLQTSMERLEMAASTDHLTGLSNRRRFKELLERSHDLAMRYGHDLACCMCDLDHYKELNDTLGHQVGDELLMLTANVICCSLRSSDVAARYGGDEFVLLLPYTSADQATAVSDRIRQQLEEAAGKMLAGQGRLTISIGIATLYDNKPATADALVAMADKALYQAKDQGKNRIVVHSAVPAGAV